MAVLVTGANGFVGAHLCRFLHREGRRVVALVHRHDDRLRTLVDAGSEIICVRGDVLDSDSLERTMSKHGVAMVCHLAMSPAGSPGDGMNVSGTQQVIGSALQVGIARVVFTSSMSVYDFRCPQYLPVDERHPLAPRQEYGRQKVAAENSCRRLAQAGDVDVSILRLAGVYGPGKRRGAVFNFLRQARSGEGIHISENRGIDLLYVDDAVRAIAAAIENKPKGVEIMNIGAGRAVSLEEVATQACAVVGRQVPVYCGGQEGEFYLDISIASQRLDYRPTPLQTGMRAFATWMAREGN